MSTMPGSTTPPNQPAAPAPDPSGMKGMFHDASTLAATGLLLAVALAIVAGLFNAATNQIMNETRERLLSLTNTVDVGDVALIGLAVALLILTPDPPGGVDRPILLKLAGILSFLIAVYGVIRSVVLAANTNEAVIARLADFLATMGVALAAATVGYFAFKESSLHKKGLI